MVDLRGGGEQVEGSNWLIVVWPKCFADSRVLLLVIMAI